jgi:predicted ester cyclase
VTDNKAVVRRFLDELYNRGNVDVADEVCLDPGAMRDHIVWLRGEMPDLRLSVDDQIAEGDKVVTRWTVHGMHDGRPTTAMGITIDRIANGRIVEEWVQYGVEPNPA